jgi:hypothetical protein
VTTDDFCTSTGDFCTSTGEMSRMWRGAYGRGFRDALRLAARRTDQPEMWLMLSQLGEEFNLGGDPGRR